jgi:mannose-6-phosphate isomerase-like protein (cupin superfamily)
MTQTRPVLLTQASEAELIGQDPTAIRLHRDASATDGVLSTQEVRLGVGRDGAVPHYHARSHELFYVAEGELQVLADGEILTLSAGGSLVVPKHVVHAFGASPDSAVRVFIALTPGVERFEYFRVLERIERGQTSVQELLDNQETFDTYFVDAPEWARERAAGRSESARG